MNPFDRLPGPRGDHDGVDVWHVIGTLFVIALVVVALIAVGTLLWNSFKVRSEVRALRGEVALLRGVELPGGGEAAESAAPRAKPTPAPADGLAVPPKPAPADGLAVPPTPKASAATAAVPATAVATTPVPKVAAPKVAAPKAPRAPKKKPTDSAE